MIERARGILRSVFGFDDFISLQREVIESVLGGRDSLAVMPTGGGKSLCYQIPALIFDGLTVVVSPLIALMKDQVEQLRQHGVPAVLLNSSISADVYRHNVEQIRRGEAKLLYLAPETLLRPQLLALLESVDVSCLAVDEAHCISEWGHDFRPEYRQISDVRIKLPNAVCIALTATATARVRKDIMSVLGVDDSSEFVASFNRENLLIHVVPKEKPFHQACELLRRYPNDSGIIYCSTRKQVDQLCVTLSSEGFSVSPYHAGLTDGERELNQERFVRDEVRVIVATIAFGMGIDKSNIRFVLHYDLPKNIESYYQEIGRSGRDGMRAECVLFFSYGDIHKIKHWIKDKEGLERRAANLQLNALLQFAESDFCRRIPLLAYFGEAFPHEQCGMCDNCLAAERPTVDLTVPAQKFLSCVRRTGERFGIMHTIDVLRGSKAEKVVKFGHQRLSTYGIGMELSRRQWHQVARQMLHRGFMVQDPEIGGLSLTPKAWDVFRGQEAVFGRLDDAEAPPASPDAAPQSGAPAYDRNLFEALRRKRKELADEANVPPYVVFSDRTLAEMAAYIPRNADALLRIHGIGRAKLDRYGSVFLEVIEKHCREHSMEDKGGSPPGPGPAGRGSTRRMREIVTGQGFNSGKTIESLARELNVRESRIFDYLLSYLQDGNPLRAEGFLPHISLSGQGLERVMEAFKSLGSPMLKPIHEALGGEVGYDDLGILRLYFLSLQESTGVAQGNQDPKWQEKA